MTNIRIRRPRNMRRKIVVATLALVALAAGGIVSAFADDDPASLVYDAVLGQTVPAANDADLRQVIIPPACTVYRVVLPVVIRYEPTVPEAVLKKRVSPVNPVSVIAPVPSSVDRFVSEPFGPLTTLTKTPPFVSCVLVPAQISVCVVPSNVE